MINEFRYGCSSYLPTININYIHPCNFHVYSTYVRVRYLIEPRNMNGTHVFGSRNYFKAKLRNWLKCRSVSMAKVLRCSTISMHMQGGPTKATSSRFVVRVDGNGCVFYIINGSPCMPCRHLFCQSQRIQGLSPWAVVVSLFFEFIGPYFITVWDTRARGERRLTCPPIIEITGGVKSRSRKIVWIV